MKNLLPTKFILLISFFLLCIVPESVFAESDYFRSENNVTNPLAKIVYIDPSASNSTSEGTIANPFTSWQDVEWNSNTSYLQKRGTVYICNKEVTIRADSVTISAYGEGARPILRETSGTTFKMLSTNNTNITIKNLEIHSTTGSPTVGIEVWHNTNELFIDSCLIHGQMWGIRLISMPGTTKITNCEIHHTYDDGIFTKATGNVEIGHCTIYEVNQGWWDSPDVNNAVSGGDCIQISYGQSYTYIHDNILDHSTTGWKFCVIVGETATPEVIDGTADSLRLENNTMTGNKADVNSCVYLKPSLEKVIINGNVMRDGNYGIWCAGEAWIYNNVFEDLAESIWNRDGETAHIYHNTFVRADIRFIGNDAKYLDITKNLFITPTEPSKGVFLYYNGGISDYNLYSHSHSSLDNWISMGYDSNSIVGMPELVNYEVGDYNYASINSIGVNPTTESNVYGIARDKNGNLRDTNPDMGAFEFVATSKLKDFTPDSYFSIYPVISLDGIYKLTIANTKLPIKYATYNAFGKLLDGGILHDNTRQFNYSSFEGGMYFIQFFIENKKPTTKKIIKR